MTTATKRKLQVPGETAPAPEAEQGELIETAPAPTPAPEAEQGEQPVVKRWVLTDYGWDLL